LTSLSACDIFVFLIGEDAMLVTGYKLQQAIRRRMNAQEITYKQFKDGIKYFPSEEKPDLVSIFQEHRSQEVAIAALQVAQATYNLRVKVRVLGENMTLHEAVKRVGGAGRGEKMWRTAAKGEAEGSYGRYDKDQRNKDTEYSSLTVNPVDALKEANKQSKYASALREVIQIGNSVETDIDLDPMLLEE
jgi:hypothetical protein